MKKLTYGKQQILILVLLGLGHLLACLLREGYWINLAWMLSGGLFLVNPVYPQNVTDHTKGVLWTKIAGVLILLIGLTMRNNF